MIKYKMIMLSKQSKILYDYILSSSRATTVEVKWLILYSLFWLEEGQSLQLGEKCFPCLSLVLGGGSRSLQTLQVLCGSATSGIIWGWAECPPDIFQREIFADLPEKEGPGRKGKWRGKGGKFEGKTWKLKKEGKSMKLFVCLSIFFLVTFLKPLNFVWDVAYFMPGKIGKSDFTPLGLPPLKKYSSYATWVLPSFGV